MINTLFERPTLDAEDCLYKQKKWLLWAMIVAQSAENHGDK